MNLSKVINHNNMLCFNVVVNTCIYFAFLFYHLIRIIILSIKRSYYKYNEYKSYLRECEKIYNNVINSLNCDGFDIGSRCSLNLPDLR